MLEGVLWRVSNRADWTDILDFADGDTGEPIDLSSASIVFDVADDCGRRALSASTAGGTIVVVDVGAARFSFTRDEMASLCPGTYSAGCTITIGDETEQAFVGTAQVIDGVVSR